MTLFFSLQFFNGTYIQSTICMIVKNLQFQVLTVLYIYLSEFIVNFSQKKSCSVVGHKCNIFGLVSNIIVLKGGY